MTDSGEVVKPNGYGRIIDFVEKEESTPEQGAQYVAGLALEGLALACHEPEKAEQFFARSQQAFERIMESEGSLNQFPTPMEVVAGAHLNLVLPLHRLLVEDKLSPPEDIKEAYGPFVRKLSKQARAAAPLLYTNPALLDDAHAKQYGGLAAMFNGMAVVGLLMRFQFQRLYDDSWMPSPGFLELNNIDPSAQNPVNRFWHANVWGRNKDELHRFYKIYVRTVSESAHEEMEDPETSVVWLGSDLALPPDNGLVSPLRIIQELAVPKEKGQRYKLDSRMFKLLNVIDDRTYSSLK